MNEQAAGKTIDRVREALLRLTGPKWYATGEDLALSANVTEKQFSQAIGRLRKLGYPVETLKCGAAPAVYRLLSERLQGVKV